MSRSAFYVKALGSALIVLLAGAAIGSLFTLAAIPQDRPVVTLTPCATEDSTNCYWDATTHGNGQGRSFIDVDGTAYFLGK